MVDARATPGLPGRIRGFLWPTEFLVFSAFVQAEPHTHSAMQLSVGLDGESRVRLGGAWQQARAVLIDTGTVHAFDCDGTMTAIGWLEGESPAGARLCERVLAGGRYAVLGPDRRYLTAMSHLADGATATAAAHGAGFAGSAYVTRTARSMNGFTPTKLPFNRWLANCR